MKRITLGVLLLFSAVATTKAQDFKKVRGFVMINKTEEAKTELEKVLADPKAAGTAEASLLKAEIYGTIAGDPALSAKYPGANMEAWAALQKYLQLEPTEEKLKADQYKGVNSIYSSLFAEGVKSYNDKSWDSAFAKFKVVAELGDMFTSRKWSNSAFDTTSYLYAGVTAQNAKQNEEAAKYYGKIAEHKVVGQDYESLYDFLVKYYLNNKDEANFQKYVALAKEAYPKNPVWADLEFANKTDNADPATMAKAFADADAAKTLTTGNYLDYGDYFINNKKIKDLEAPQRKEYLIKASYAFSRAHDLDTANAVAAYNAGVAAYTLFEEASDSARKITGVTPTIKANRAAADKITDAAADKSIEWIEKSYVSLAAKTTRTNTEKNVVGKAADLLYNLYAYKKDRSKVLNPKDYDKFDAKSKYYDSMHGKF